MFESAIVNVTILISVRQTHNKNQIATLLILRLTVMKALKSLFKGKGLIIHKMFLLISLGSLLKPKLFLIQKKIESNNKTLEQLGTKIRLGLATGHNEAFVIDETKKKELCGLQASNAEIIRPILRGRDISRFSYKLPGLYILLAKMGWISEKIIHLYIVI